MFRNSWNLLLSSNRLQSCKVNFNRSTESNYTRWKLTISESHCFKVHAIITPYCMKYWSSMIDKVRFCNYNMWTMIVCPITGLFARHYVCLLLLKLHNLNRMRACFFSVVQQVFLRSTAYQMKFCTCLLGTCF